MKQEEEKKSLLEDLQCSINYKREEIDSLRLEAIEIMTHIVELHEHYNACEAMKLKAQKELDKLIEEYDSING